MRSLSIPQSCFLSAIQSVPWSGRLFKWKPVETDVQSLMRPILSPSLEKRRHQERLWSQSGMSSILIPRVKALV